VIDEGYPRNDALRTTPEERAAIRKRLGLAADRLVVLYAPTWRDNVRNQRQQYALVSYLDFDQAVARLPDATFLLRGHTNTASPGSTNSAVIDVSGLPDINELMIAADVLVTDYSSVMFDFCVTGRPILFLTPDLETYRDSTRGFYLDLEKIAPGPLCRGSLELVDELAELGSYPNRFAHRYTEFTQCFAARDDGHATRRVVDVVFAEDRRGAGSTP
jgi:CDP-glycerol glycerophosphotransferase